MPISIRIVPPMMPTRPCRFCLSLQEDNVFADFDVDDAGRVFLRRISFDGYGCCEGDFKKMSLGDSRFLMARVHLGAVEDPRIGTVLRAYFQKNAGLIWSDALAEYGFL